MDGAALLLSLRLALLTVVILVPLGIAAGRWLATRDFAARPLVEALFALPLVLPPTVLGYYLLVAMGAASPVGRWYEAATGHPLVFTFDGLLLASVIFNLPFAIQPLQRAFEAIPEDLRHAASCCGLTSWQSLWRIELPLAWTGLLSAAVLTFAHTLGEFGVVLMVGGNIPDKTRVVSVQIYNHVEALEYSEAHWLAGCLLVFSFSVLLVLYTVLKTQPVAHQLK
jgi:molybdate transport system permease protein